MYIKYIQGFCQSRLGAAAHATTALVTSHVHGCMLHLYQVRFQHVEYCEHLLVYFQDFV
jgi:hypothetical protein